MAFDFNNNSTRRSNTPHSSHGTGNRTHETHGTQSPSSGTSGCSHSNNPSTSMPGTGFQNRPVTKTTPNEIYEPKPVSNPPQVAKPQKYGKTRKAPKRSVGDTFSGMFDGINWKIVFYVVIAIAVIAFLVAYRAQISAFLRQLFGWVIGIAIMVLIIKWIFRRR